MSSLQPILTALYSRTPVSFGDRLIEHLALGGRDLQFKRGGLARSVGVLFFGWEPNELAPR